MNVDPRMTLPALLPAPPARGMKTVAPGLHGSSDALALAGLIRGAAPVAVICAEAFDALRLSEELLWFAPELRVLVFPDWETLPYDHFSPHQDLVSDRLATLHAASRGAFDVVLLPATTMLTRLPPPSYLAGFTFFLKQGERLDLAALRAQMTLAGYSHVTQVVSPGEYCVRGGLIDLFPMGSSVPYRIDLLDDVIDTLRTFDVDTQRTIYPVTDIRLLPAREFPFDEAGRTRFRQSFREVFEGDPSKSQLYKDVSNGIAPGGIEYYLPLFFEQTARFADYLPEATVVCLHGDVEGVIAAFWKETESRHRLLRGDRARPLLAPAEIFTPADEFFGSIKPFARMEIRLGGTAAASPTRPAPDVRVDRHAEDPVHALATLIATTPGRVLVCVESLGRRETVQQFLAEHGLQPAATETFSAFLASSEAFTLCAAPIATGFAVFEPEFIVVTETELYAANPRRLAQRDRGKRSNVETMLRDLSEVRIGDPVVHEQHGIGRYLGLVTLDLGDGPSEFLHLGYADDTKLYVPVGSLHLISRYSGTAPDDAPLHALGSGQWERAKARALKQVRDTAAELLNLYAQRAARQGHAFKFSPHDYERFAEGFQFEETPDQAAAIEAVIQDLTSDKPTDRLVCGDVGFGKTEVALRAAFVALMDNRQVAILVPTTLLAEQHFQNFSDRFADWPVKIAELSRFRSAKEVKAAVAGLADGTIDLVIGTHKLIQSDVKFKNLGLVIIDEEHRFGVRQKEQLKRLRAEVDVLTLTATPIPRTLAMAMEGLRDFSVIATAPQRRLSIKTFVAGFSEGLIREAALRELKRGGQVYFLHNEIDTIKNMEEKLIRLLPEARVRIGHGQMPERELEQVMRDFYQQRCNVLLCSTIIETGIDVPTANTIIINRADRFGLAQLHQLRGRVGRSHHQAYAYLLTPGPDALTANAQKRLEAIQMLEDLGSGFFLAMHDLEIRGAGEVLGESQSGEMQEVGFQLYTDMLSAAVNALKAGREPDMEAPLGVTTEINLHTPALLPGSYCGDVHERLVLYKRLANCGSMHDLEQMQEELIDRFGLPPEPAQTLLECHRLRILGKPLGVTKVDAAAERVIVSFVARPPFEPIKLIQLIQRDGRFRFAGPDRLRIEWPTRTLEDRVTLVKDFLQKLA
jgi:transcription-repair coupling factor (superfamily II helicase)